MVYVYVLFQWLKDGFLKYLQDWEDSVHSREGFSKAKVQKMLLSREFLVSRDIMIVYVSRPMQLHY